MDNESAAEIALLKLRYEQLLQGIRIILLTMLLAAAFIDLRSTLNIPALSSIATDLLGPDAALPWISRLVAEHAGLHFWAAVLLTVLGLASLLVARARVFGLVIAAIAATLLFLHYQLIIWACQAPLNQLLDQLGEPPK